jgi:hypothetical protein
LGVYPWASREVEDWSRKLGEPLSADSWSNIFREHPEFFRLNAKGWASLRWRHGYDRTFDVEHGRDVSSDEITALSGTQKEQLTRKPLEASQIEALLKTAVEFHSRTIAQEQERRWLTPLIFGLMGSLLALLGTILGVILKS